MMVKSVRGLLIVLLLFSLVGCGKKTPEQQVRATIKDMVVLIDKGDLKKLLLTYADPAFVERIKKSGRVDAIVANLKQRKAERLKKYLNEALAAKAEVSKDGKKVSFKLKNRRRPMVFSQVKGRWYLNN
jgi:hypothetical protein